MKYPARPQTAASRPAQRDPFAALDDDFDVVCRTLRAHGVGEHDVQHLAAQLLLSVWAIEKHAGPRRRGPWLVELAERVARDRARA